MAQSAATVHGISCRLQLANQNAYRCMHLADYYLQCEQNVIKMTKDAAAVSVKTCLQEY